MARHKSYSNVFISDKQAQEEFKERLRQVQRVCKRDGVPEGLGDVEDLVACINVFAEETVKEELPALYNHLPRRKFNRDDYYRLFKNPGSPAPLYLVCLYFLAQEKKPF